MGTKPTTRLEALLLAFCDHSYCSALREAEAIIANPPTTATAFVDLVLTLEGLDPDTTRQEDRLTLERLVVDWLFDPAGKGARSGLP